MAVIGKIQKNSLLLLIVVGVAMLAFIFTDLMRSNGDDVERLPVATVWGEPINESEYFDLQEQFTERDRQNTEAQGREYDESMAQQSEDAAFNEIVRRTLMNTEFEKLGLTCTSNELNDMIHGNHIHPWVMQIPLFQNPMTGAFERDSVRLFINNLEVEPDDEAARAQWLEARRQWKTFEQELKDNRMAEKYVTMIKKGMYVNSIEAKDQYNGIQNKKNISFVIQRFTDIEPGTFDVTDEEIEAYYNEHKDEPKWEQEESRDIDYVIFPIKATANDLENIKFQMEDVKAALLATDNEGPILQQHTETGFYSDSAYFRMGKDAFVFDQFMGNNEYPASLDDQIQEAQIGDIVGPVDYVGLQDQENYVAIAKVTNLQKENQAWVRHILVKTDINRTEEQAKAKADSLIKVIEANDNFVEMVSAHTDDPGSIANGGEYKWFAEGRMVDEFNDASFNGPIGKLQLVKTTYGYHIVEVLGRAERTIPALAVVAKKVEPSEQSIKEMEELVFDFIFRINESEGDSTFHRAAEDSSLTVQSTRVWMPQNFVMGLENPLEVMRFAFGRHSEEGDISDPIFDGDKYVVAYLANVIEEGAPEFRDVKVQMRGPALKEKQANHYVEKMSGKKSLDEVAAVCTNGVVLDAEVMFGNNTILGGGGNEPEIIGNLFTNIPVGSMTKPLIGNTGVYVVVVNSEVPAPETTDYTEIRSNMKVAKASAADGGVMKALRDRADVQDNRRKKELQGI